MLNSCNNKTKWQEVNEFVIYNRYNLKIDEINEESFYQIDTKYIYDILSKSTILEDTTFLWKGYRLAKITFKNGDISYMRISIYGDVIYDLSSKNLYKMPEGIGNKLFSYSTE